MIQDGVSALVLFSSRGSHPLAGLLHPDFKHVWCAVKERDYWVSYDWLDGRVQLRVEAAADFDLQGFYEKQGLTVVPLILPPPQKARWPVMLNNCVGHTKLICGIKSRAVTPHGLYKHLTRGSRYASTLPPPRNFRSSGNV